MDEEEDRLSSLPDCLLVEIISRLPEMKYTIRTGTLSKRWQHLWTQIPNLIFINEYGGNHNQMRKFFSFVDKVLTQCCHLNLVKFKVDTNYNIQFASQVNNWIRYAVNCNIQELDLLLKIPGIEGGFVLDSESFSSSSCFTKLNLGYCRFNPTGAISWNKLTSLSLKFVKLDEELIQNILSGSPLLETFRLKFCYGFRRMDITSKSLKNLVFTGYLNFDSFNNAHIIQVNAPNIWSLAISGGLGLRKLSLVDVSCLVKAHLDYRKIENHDESHETNKQVEEEMLKGFILKLCHVKELTIGYSCQKVLSRLKTQNFTFPSNLKS